MLETKHKEAQFASAWLVETFEQLGAAPAVTRRKTCYDVTH
ncbi:hypothetical protein RJD24_01875 [Bacillaceae bacterium IKA-2]|nr:hypothetical protein RJD24_01875 [Bacillaceae bacterium IKA-2]